MTAGGEGWIWLPAGGMEDDCWVGGVRLDVSRGGGRPLVGGGLWLRIGVETSFKSWTFMTRTKKVTPRCPGERSVCHNTVSDNAHLNSALSSNIFAHSQKFSKSFGLVREKWIIFKGWKISWYCYFTDPIYTANCKELLWFIKFFLKYRQKVN